MRFRSWYKGIHVKYSIDTHYNVYMYVMYTRKILIAHFNWQNRWYKLYKKIMNAVFFFKLEVFHMVMVDSSKKYRRIVVQKILLRITIWCMNEEWRDWDLLEKLEKFYLKIQLIHSGLYLTKKKSLFLLIFSHCAEV